MRPRTEKETKLIMHGYQAQDPRMWTSPGPRKLGTPQRDRFQVFNNMKSLEHLAVAGQVWLAVIDRLQA